MRRARTLLVALCCLATVVVPAWTQPAVADTILEETFESSTFPPTGWEDEASPAIPDFDEPWSRETTCSIGSGACAASIVEAGAPNNRTGRLNMEGFDT